MVEWLSWGQAEHGGDDLYYQDVGYIPALWPFVVTCLCVGSIIGIMLGARHWVASRADETRRMRWWALPGYCLSGLLGGFCGGAVFAYLVRIVVWLFS